MKRVILILLLLIFTLTDSFTGEKKIKRKKKVTSTTLERIEITKDDSDKEEEKNELIEEIEEKEDQDKESIEEKNNIKENKQNKKEEVIENSTFTYKNNNKDKKTKEYKLIKLGDNLIGYGIFGLSFGSSLIGLGYGSSVLSAYFFTRQQEYKLINYYEFGSKAATLFIDSNTLGIVFISTAVALIVSGGIFLSTSILLIPGIIIRSVGASKLKNNRNISMFLTNDSIGVTIKI